MGEYWPLETFLAPVEGTVGRFTAHGPQQLLGVTHQEAGLELGIFFLFHLQSQLQGQRESTGPGVLIPGFGAQITALPL